MTAIPMCPHAYVGGDIWELLLYADLYAKGNPPISGGALDQTRFFLEACQLIWAEENQWKRRLMSADG